MLLLPEELVVNLFSADQEFKLFEPCKSAVLENFRRHVNSLEQFVKLLRASLRVPRTLEVRQMFPDFLKGNPVTAIVRAWGAERELAAGESFRHESPQFPSRDNCASCRRH